jgi:serine protease Do
MRVSRYRFLGLIVVIAALGWTTAAADQGTARVIRLGSGDGAYLGIEMEDVTTDDVAKYGLSRERGIIVRNVLEDTPAEEAGLQEGDVILEYSGIPVISTSQFSRLVQETPAGRAVDLKISRNGAEMTLEAKLAEGKGPFVWRGGRGGLVLPRGEDRDFRFFGPEEFSFEFEKDWPEAYFVGSRSRLGVTLTSLTDQMAEFLGVQGTEGVLVTSVTEGSSADGKLRAGDVITAADGKAVDSASDLRRTIGKRKEGESVELEVVRDKREISVLVEFGKKKPGYIM